ncbi:hypothetical protein D9M71_358250 [compost metagenome]
MGGALQFLAVVAAMHALAFAVGSGHVHVGVVAEHILGLVQRTAHGRRQQFGAARADADHAEPAARPTDGSGRCGILGLMQAQPRRLPAGWRQCCSGVDETQRHTQFAGGTLGGGQ